MAADDHPDPVVVDPLIWRALAGDSVQIPTLYSKVYYFPQGHVEHCGVSSLLISASNASPVPCLVTSVELLADPITDEVFAHLSLQPMARDQLFLPNLYSRFGRFEGDAEENQVISVDKILTASDANNGGGFSVPRNCADTVLPPLDFQADPPVQNLSITDIHGAVWKFRHIYRGSPRRHLLTTGWSKFVNNKKLIAGDSVVFMRNSVDELFIGVKRAPISSNGGGEYTGYYQSTGGDDGNAQNKFRRIGKGKLTAKAVSEAINRAALGLAFEVDYYPTAGWSEFVVKAEAVDASMAIPWNLGTRVKMAMGTKWVHGTVSSTNQETGPWKMLQITWDEPEIMKKVKWVSPWQVQVTAISSQLYATFPPSKRLKPSHPGGFFNGEGEIYCYERGQSSNAAADPSLYDGFSCTTTFPAGMQGARQFESFNPTEFIRENTPYNFFSPRPMSEEVSTATKFGSLPSDTVSPKPVLAKAKSIKIFGKIINVQEHSESSLAESSSYKEDVSKESSDNNEDLSEATQSFLRYVRLRFHAGWK